MRLEDAVHGTPYLCLQVEVRERELLVRVVAVRDVQPCVSGENFCSSSPPPPNQTLNCRR